MARRLSRRLLATYATEQIIAGADKTTLINQLAGYLVENRRTKEVDLIVRDIEAALAERGTVVAHVSSARPLSDKSLESVRSIIGSIGSAKSVQLRSSVVPGLLGGVVIEVPGGEFDGSLRRRLNVLKSRNNYI